MHESLGSGSRGIPIVFSGGLLLGLLGFGFCGTLALKGNALLKVGNLFLKVGKFSLLLLSELLGLSLPGLHQSHLRRPQFL